MAISFFQPRVDFFKLLYEQAMKTEEGMAALLKFINESTEENGRQVKVAEQEADEIRRIIMDELNRAFVTPIDREDISGLSHFIDDVIDYAESTVEEMILFGIKPDTHIKQMVETLYEATKDLVRGVKTVRSHPGSCTEHIIRAKKAENKVEKCYRQGLVELFQTSDVITILKTREIYRHLSNAADRIVTACNTIGDVLIKNS